PLFHTELPWGHGVVWDRGRRVLWALGNEDIRVYELAEWDTPAPSLRRTALIPLPESGGHDLQPVPGTDLLSVTTGRHVWLFNRDRRTFAPHPELADLPGVKCVSVHPKTGRLVYVQQEGANWWAERLHFLRPQETLHLPGEHLYKARWWSGDPAP
ncbi:MAG: DUF6528 family protein, partial [Armatimonadota bacterium]|nr:DUF6528 family protein [Armatimonadota bacterium]